MNKDIIYNLKSLLIIKNKIKFSINDKFEFKNKIVKIKHSIYLKDRNDFQITKFIKESHTLKTFNPNIEYRLPILINHAVFPFYIDKYKITDKYLIQNIGEFYRLTKVFVDMFNKKYGNQHYFEIDINHDVIFTILKYNETKFDDIEKYKKERIENIFSEELFNAIRRL